MKVRINTTAAALERESELIASFARRASASGEPTCRIAIRNSDGDIRVVVATASEAEEDSVTELLADAKYNDELLVDEEEHTGTSIEHSARVDAHPDFDCIYSRLAPRVERRQRASRDDPGPDPSWILWYSP